MVLELTKALNQILQWETQHKAQDLQYLQPGLSKAEIDKLVKDLPFQLPLEVYELYQWRNGSRQGEEEWQNASIFYIVMNPWTFRPLQEVVEICLEDIRKKRSRPANTFCLPRLVSYVQSFYRLSIFYTIDYTCSGTLWLNQEGGLSPVVFCSCDEGEIAIIAIYSSLTSLTQTILKCQEAGIIYNREYNLDWHYELEERIWRKYNSELREFALQVLQKQPFSELAWIHIVSGLVKFKDLRNSGLLIQWLIDLINAYREPNFRRDYDGYIDRRLYRQDPTHPGCYCTDQTIVFSSYSTTTLDSYR